MDSLLCLSWFEGDFDPSEAMAATNTDALRFKTTIEVSIGIGLALISIETEYMSWLLHSQMP